MRIVGTSGGDTLSDTAPGAGDDLLRGIGGNDLLRTTAGVDTLLGGAGLDIADFSARGGGGVFVRLARPAAAELNSGTALRGIEGVVGTAFDDVMTGNVRGNLLIGGAGDDVVDGRGGDDMVLGGLGDDALAGGAGFDMVSYAGAAGPVAVDLVAGTATGEGTDTLSGFEAVIGSAFDDSLAGDAADNLLDGGAAGADTLVGGAGFDTVSFADRGGSVLVLLDPGVEVNSGASLAGVEAVVGTRFGDSITGDAASNLLDGLRGDDVLDGGAGDDVLVGGAGDDLLTGGDGFDEASYHDAPGVVVVDLAAGTGAGWGSDTLTGIEGVVGSAFDDSLAGDAGDNVLDGGPGGADTLVGGGGFDTASFVERGGSVTVLLDPGVELNSGSSLVGIRAVVGSRFGDAVTGDGAANRLDGSGGDDVLNGRAGNDTLVGGAGDDVLTGGGGVDVASYHDAPGAVVVDLAAGIATGAWGTDTLLQVENADGSAFDDLLTGSAADNRLDAGTAGADTLLGGGGFDVASFAYRTGSVVVVLDPLAGTEVNSGSLLVGMAGAAGGAFGDLLIGDAGGNWLGGAGGGDVLDGGAGDDTLVGGVGDDALDGGAGLDVASYADLSVPVAVDLAAGTAVHAGGTDTLAGIEGAIGTAGDDTLAGDSGDNWLDGGAAGADVLDGGAGFDTASFAGRAAGGVVVDLGGGLELNSRTTLAGIEGVVGTAAGDLLTGDALANVLGGLGGDDVLDGGAGDDTLAGGAGSNVLVGGDGFDVAAYAAAAGGVAVDLAAGTAAGGGGAALGDALAGIEGVVGSAFDDTLSDGAGASLLTGGGGADLFVLRAGLADGDVITDFDGAGALPGDRFVFTGYGAGTFTSIGGDLWRIRSFDGAVEDVVLLSNGTTVNPSDYVFA